MKYLKTSFAVLALGAIAAGAPAQAKPRQAAPSTTLSTANAQGTPQRDASRVPPGLAKLLADTNRGIARALIATQGSNSRLQDQPDSP